MPQSRKMGWEGYVERIEKQELLAHFLFEILKGGHHIGDLGKDERTISKLIKNMIRTALSWLDNTKWQIFYENSNKLSIATRTRNRLTRRMVITCSRKTLLPRISFVGYLRSYRG